MSFGIRVIPLTLLIALAAFVGWRVLKVGMAEQLVGEQPQKALEWNSENPDALLAEAQAHLGRQEPELAADVARTLLTREPANGRGFVVLSESARLQGDREKASEWSSIALRYLPQALGPRAWIAGQQLESGHYAEALESIDRILRVWPRQSEQLFPALMEFTQDPKFADALAVKLATLPTWKDGFVSELLNKGTPDTLDRVLPAMRRHGALDTATIGRWIDRLTKDGAWGEAYARWVSATDQRGANRMSSVYNGGFESAPSNAGFDWRIGDSAGVIIERAAVTGATGSYAISLTFLGRRVDSIPLNEWLLLSGGTYRLSFRAAAHELRSDRGLAWVIRCQQTGQELAASERLTGDFDWTQHEVEFSVPESNCTAQDLWLRNAGAAGAGKIIRGSISFDDIAIDRVAQSAKAALAQP